MQVFPSSNHIRKALLAILFLMLSTTVVTFGQSQAQIRKKGDASFQEATYSMALNYYTKLSNKQVQSPYIQYQLGRCHFYLSNFGKALSYFQPYLLNKKHDDEALLYTAKALHQVGKYTDALRFYKLYLKVTKLDASNRTEVKSLLLQCNTAIKLSNIQSQAIVVTLGKVLNSPYNEFLPIYHPSQEDQLFFSSNRPGSTPLKEGGRSLDIWVSMVDQGNWQDPEPLSPRYNSEEEDILYAFPDNGYQILFFRGPELEKGNGRIDNYNDGSEEALFVDFAPLCIQGEWTADYYLFSDSLVLFSSQRPYNYGGKDLYYSVKRSDGKWSEAINLGPEINSQYDERSPFLAVDGRSLYFSSNRSNSIGGYDVFKSLFSDSLKIWSTPSNLGLPINSAGDDLFFQLEKDGLRGYLSSERNGGEGAVDIYSIYFRKYLKEQFTYSSPPDFADVLFQNQRSIRFNNPSKENELIKKITKSNNAETNLAEGASIFTLHSIFYDGNSGQLSPGSEKTINNLKRLLLKYQEVIVLITVHTDNISPLESNLFLSVQQGERIAEILVQEGINSKRILIRGCAQNYPIAKNYNFDGSPNETGQRLNRRIDFDIYNTSDLPIKIENNRPMVSSVMIDNMANNYSQRLEGLCYKVQLLKTPTLYTHSMLEKMKDASTEKVASTPSVSYCIGMAKNFDAILSIFETAQEMGFSQAKIVPYLNGFPINIAEAQALFSNYPDLEKYLEFEENK